MANLRTWGLAVAVGCATLGSTACGQSHEAKSSPLFVEGQYRALVWGETWGPAGGGCFDLMNADGVGGGTSGFLFGGPPSESPRLASVPESQLEDFMIDRLPDPEGMRVVVTLNEKQLANKLYSIEFLETGAVDRLEFTTPLGNRIQIAQGGVPECDGDGDVSDDIDLFAE